MISPAPYDKAKRLEKWHFWDPFLIRVPDNILATENKIHFPKVTTDECQSLFHFFKVFSYSMPFLHVTGILIEIIYHLYYKFVIKHLRSSHISPPDSYTPGEKTAPYSEYQVAFLSHVRCSVKIRWLATNSLK